MLFVRRRRSDNVPGDTGGVPMTAAIGREELSERAVEAGWHRRDEGRTDYYSRSPVRIQAT